MSSLWKVDGLVAGYGRSQVLFGMSLEIQAGQCVTLLGRNGMGKTTTVRTIMGQIKPTGGTITRFGQAKNNMEPFELSRSGIGLVPEGRQIFTNLSVRENLGTFFRPARDGETIWTMDTVLDLFPRLRERLSHGGANLSGGEQQMLAIARAMVAHPKLVMLDEPSEGIMPVLVDEMFALFAAWKRAGKTLLLVEQNATVALGTPPNRIATRWFWGGRSRVMQ